MRPPILLDRKPSPFVGSVVALGAVAATTVLIFGLRELVPAISTGVVYLVAVMLVSTYGGLWLGLATALASTLAFNFFHIPPTGELTISDPKNWVALVVYLAAAAIASTVAELARSRTAEAEARRQEADLTAELATILLGSASLDDALASASHRLGESLDLPGAALSIEPAAASGRRSIPLAIGAGHTGSLELPASVDPELADRIRERVAPSLGTLLAAVLDRDALQREAAETVALRRSDLVKTAVLRAVSHDLRSPLTGIITAGEALRMGNASDTEREELAGVVVGEASRLGRLVDQLLDLSRLEAGAAEPRTDWCSLEEVVRGAIEQIGDADGAPIELDIAEELPLVRADAAQLERVFVNLIENARRYSGRQPVKIRAETVGNWMSVRVIDRGPGLSRSERERIFEPFYRLPDAHKHHGSGLGLAIVRGFTEANGGRVRVESLPGQGSMFAVELPLVERAIEGAAE